MDSSYSTTQKLLSNEYLKLTVAFNMAMLLLKTKIKYCKICFRIYCWKIKLIQMIVLSFFLFFFFPKEETVKMTKRKESEHK